jgi:hypothetical protein
MTMYFHIQTSASCTFDEYEKFFMRRSFRLIDCLPVVCKPTLSGQNTLKRLEYQYAHTVLERYKYDLDILLLRKRCPLSQKEDLKIHADFPKKVIDVLQP